jgi:single-stranded-DNA-specific exonuclease
VDCGISAINEVALAKKLGLDIVVTDHHQQGESLPETIIVNPMQEGDTYPFKHLAGVGVAFKLCMGLRHHLRGDEGYKGAIPNLKKYLDIVALGTIADVVPLLGENRTFVLHGLKVLEGQNVRQGLSELKKVSGLSRTISASNIGFGLVPRINAVGRMGDSDRGFRLLITNNISEARRLAAELDEENHFRQDIEREILREAFEYIEKHKLSTTRMGFVVHAERWHPGVLGIVASRITDKYFRPTIVLTSDGEQMKGSARSIPGYHLYEGLKGLSELLVSFGGHKYAAGLKIKRERIPDLEDRFDASVRSDLAEDDFIPCIKIDAVVEATDINERFMSVLAKFEPFGNSNKEPVFCMLNVEKYQYEQFVGKNRQHLKCTFIKSGIVFDAIGYDMKMYETLMKSNNHFDILFTLAYNNYGRSSTIQLILKDIRAAE